MKTVRIGAGAGYAGDRIEPALELAEKGALDYLIFECLAERTIALAQQARRKNPAGGFDPLLGERLRAVLAPCRRAGTRIVTNMGAANPLAAAEQAASIARELGFPGLRIAAVTGDDVVAAIAGSELAIEESGSPISALGDSLVSANAYIGAEPIAAALAAGADIVITGRAADPSLFVGPLVHEFGWSFDDWRRLGQATLIGHLLECAGQVTGGYFADPGFKDVAGLARLGFPIGEASEDGSVVVTKVEGSGGQVTTATCKEQILYELHDPARYLTPDVTADFSQARVTQIGPDRVRIEGASGRARPEQLKVSLGIAEGFTGEGQISYAGPGARARGEIALAIVRERLALTGVATSELRFDLIGVNALHGETLSARGGQEPYEVRARIAGRTANRAEAERIGREVETLYTNGPAGGGGVTTSVREVLGVLSTYLPREQVAPTVHILES
ncbi:MULTISPECIES: acyclic terpene utilization AtuA family protein [unclassified Bosea (in: a-proteobacteria)]|uniref:acyclic terpene utilization AtuA family protein n=1 Tax=unclassified Bosea (in: a-proteobacteria) TaxID=2653178 RepID=UPI000F7643DA|nr:MULTISPECIES: acyclic terpene utilization AtuA family protein [unclassified Bosea (in: a-proteobacteria)]AZO78850.1 ABC transporter substrate-binding protein [Bosea sp. Tri-49]RXT17360.1 ABC transporter substrate-binding protein [Bosea sp. Tri-39]RXT40731.1 ABC transporter substrate-binding protein [Bosea sp. Tri-54]